MATSSQRYEVMRRQRGALMLELLVASASLAVIAAAVAGALQFSSARLTEARHQEIAFGESQSAVERVIGLANKGLAVVGTTTTKPTLKGLPGAVTVTTTIAKGSQSDLLDVTVVTSYTTPRTTSPVTQTLVTRVWNRN